MSRSRRLPPRRPQRLPTRRPHWQAGSRGVWKERRLVVVAN
ncbi:hypothetical protein [Deinococcus sp.]